MRGRPAERVVDEIGHGAWQSRVRTGWTTRSTARRTGSSRPRRPERSRALSVGLGDAAGRRGGSSRWRPGRAECACLVKQGNTSSSLPGALYRSRPSLRLESSSSRVSRRRWRRPLFMELRYTASADSKEGEAGGADSTTALEVWGGELLSGPVGRPGGSSERQEKRPTRTATAATAARRRPRRRIRPCVSRRRHEGSGSAPSGDQASPTRPFLVGYPVRSWADGSRGADRAMASSLSVRNRLQTESGVGFGIVAHFLGGGVPCRCGASGGRSVSRRTKGIMRPASRRADSVPSAGSPK